MSAVPPIAEAKRARVSSPRGVTTLMYACQQGDVEKVRRILRAQPDTIAKQDRSGKSALHYCSTSDSKCAAQAADLLVMAASDLVESRDEDGFTPLHLAVIAGNMPLVTFLLANNADINAVDSEKHTVVHWATVCGETGALRAVLAAGAPVSTPDVHGGYPLHYAAQMCGGDKDSSLGLQVLHALLQHQEIKVDVEDGDGRQPLLWAASAGSAKAVLALIRAGATVNAPDKDGLTALHCAASRGHTDCIDTLLTLCGMSPDVIDSNGCTALHYSVTLGHADATALLLTHGADPNRQDRKGRSPAHCGCAKGQFETVKMIGSREANLWLRNARGDLPLHEAAASGRRELVKWLLEARPSQVNARNNDGRCPLHLAALNDNSDMCKILLDTGAQVNPVLRTSRNNFMTPLDCALQRGFRSTAKYLQLHGGVPANRLGPSRANLPNGTANLHIREEVTFGETTDSEREGEEKEERTKRRHRKKLTYKYERKKTISSGKEDEDPDARASSSIEKERKREKSAARRRASSAEKGEKKSDKETKSKENVTYSSEVKITNNYGGINIEKNGEIIINDGSPNIKTRSAKTKMEAEINLPDIAKESSKVKLTESTKVIDPEVTEEAIPVPSDTSNKKKVKIGDKKDDTPAKTVNISENIEEIKSLASTIEQTAKSITEEVIQIQHNLEIDEAIKLKQQDQSSYTSADESEHKELIVEAAVHQPPKSPLVAKEIEEEEPQTVSAPQEVDAEKEDEQKETIIESTQTAPDTVEIVPDEVEKSKQEEEKTKRDEEVEEEKKPEEEQTEKGEEEEEEEKPEKEKQEDKEPEKEEKAEEMKQEEEEAIEGTLKTEEAVTDEATEIQKEITVAQKDDEGTKIKVNITDEETAKESASQETEEDKPPEIKVDEPQEIKEDKPEEVEGEPQEIEAEEPQQIKDSEINEVSEVEKEKAEIDEVITSKEDASDVSISTPDTVKLAERTSSVHEVEITAELKEPVKEPDVIKEDVELSTADQSPQEIDEAVVATKPSVEEETEKEQIQADAEGVTSVSVESKDKPNGKPKKFLKDKKQRRVEETPRTVPKQDKIKPVDSVRDKKQKVMKKDRPKRDVKVAGKEKEEGDKSRDKEKIPRKAIEKVLDVTDRGAPNTKVGKRKKEVRLMPKTKPSRKSSEERTSEEEEISTSSESDRRRKHKSFTVLDDVKVDDHDKKKSKIPTPVFGSRKDLTKDDRHLDRSEANGLDTRISLPDLPKENRPRPRLAKIGSAYSDNDRSPSDLEERTRSATRRRRLRRRLKRDSRSAGSDYESSNLIDSGFEPSPRSTKIPRWKNMSERGANMTSVTQSIQSNIRRYHLERKVFQQLLELKRLQIRSGQHNEALLVKRAIDDYHSSCASTVGAGRYVPEDYSFKNFEKFLYHALRKLQKSDTDHLRGLPEVPDNPLLCTQSTHRCLHATHAYTGIPCAAYLPKMDHHTIPKIGYPCKPQGFLPHIHPKKTVTLELLHGNDKQVISLPTDRLDQNKRYYVTFTVKGQEPTSPRDGIQNRDDAHRHAKSV